MNRPDAFSSNMDKLSRRLSGAGRAEREAELRKLFASELRDLGEDFALDLYAEYLAVLAGRGIEDPFGVPDWLYGCVTLAAQDYDSAAGFEAGDWAAIARCVDGSSETLDIEFINYAVSLILEGGGFRE